MLVPVAPYMWYVAFDLNSAQKRARIIDSPALVYFVVRIIDILYSEIVLLGIYKSVPRMMAWKTDRQILLAYKNRSTKRKERYESISNLFKF